MSYVTYEIFFIDANQPQQEFSAKIDGIEEVLSDPDRRTKIEQTLLNMVRARGGAAQSIKIVRIERVTVTTTRERIG